MFYHENGGHLGQWTGTMWSNICSLDPRKLNLKYDKDQLRKLYLLLQVTFIQDFEWNFHILPDCKPNQKDLIQLLVICLGLMHIYILLTNIWLTPLRYILVSSIHQFLIRRMRISLSLSWFENIFRIWFMLWEKLKRKLFFLLNRVV